MRTGGSGSRAFETKLNVLLGRILSHDLKLNATSECIVGKNRPDLIIYFNGVKIVLEGSYSEKDAKTDIKKRIEEGFGDIGVALLYKEYYPPNLTDSELENVLRSSTFRIWLIVPEDISETLRNYFENKKIEPKLVTESGMDVRIPDLVSILNDAIQFLIREEDVLQSISEIENKIGEFVKKIKSTDEDKNIAKNLYDIFYKLYGLSMGDYSRIDELIYAKAALALFLSTTFYESICVQKGLPGISSLCKQHGYKLGLRKAFEKILRIDYAPIYNLAIQVLETIPNSVNSLSALKDIVELAEKCSSKSTLLKKDFSGKIYHKIVGDWSVRKNFATYFTTVPAAYLLAYLAVFTRTGVFQSFNESVKVGDLACGSGTLLTAVYNALRDLYIYSEFGKGGQIDLRKFHKTMLEEGIWGMDALRYAVQIASTNLALQDPLTAVDRMNMFAVPLGKEDRKVLLGSLEFFQGKRIPEISMYFEEKGLQFMKEAKEASIIGGKIPSELPDFDLIIMNPPFTRATGRKDSKEKRKEEERGLFGFILDKETREDVLEKYRELRESVKEDLEKRLDYLRKYGDLCEKIDVLAELDINELYSIGHAGEGLLFLYLADKHVKENGKIAFVLPKSLLTGISWFLARCLLLSKFHVEHIVVSYDSENGYNFSESTSLSETLIVARKRGQAEKDEITTVTLLHRKPSTSLEARALAFRILSSKEGFIEVNGAKAYTYTVPRSELVKKVFNWGSLLAFPEPQLTRLATDILEGRVFNTNIPIVELGRIADIGIDRRQFHDSFTIIKGKVPTSLPAIYGGEEDVRSQMLIEPNARMIPKERRTKDGEIKRPGDELFKRFASTLLVPDRIRVNTSHVISIYSSEPVLSNIFYAVKLRHRKEGGEKALCLWLNTTWGILSILANRSETEGVWISLKITHWKLQPVLDITRLSEEQVAKLAEVFDRYCNETPRRLPEQFKPDNIDPVRKKIDTEFLNALDIKFEERELLELYSLMYHNLKAWIDSEESQKGGRNR
jgi:hypothetical protein